jgi:uncharacterized protein YggE
MNEPMHDSSESLPHALVRASRSVRYAATTALILLAVFLLVETIATAQGINGYTSTSPNTITVTGEGTATAIPDTATVSFGATATAADVATAQANVTKIINAALAGVKANGVADTDITTTSFDVSPHYTTPVCPPTAMPLAIGSSGAVSSGVVCSGDSTVTGYDVSENVSVKITDTSKVGTILDGLAKANVTNVSGPDFVVGDPDAVIAQARGQAIQKAQADAQKLASQLGVRLGSITSFSDNNGSGVVQPMFKAAGVMTDSAAAAPSVPVGQNTYTEDVSITYQIH